MRRSSPGPEGPTDDARAAVLAGAEAILVDGLVPAGALGLDDRLDVPVVGLPTAAAAALRAAIARGTDVRVSLGAPGWQDNGRRASIAPFSSHGLAFGGGVKPEVAAAGVELVTADPGRNDDQTARYGTISGSSAAAALAGGAAAVLAQARPELDAAALKGALVGTAVPIRRSPVAAQGARRHRPRRRDRRRGRRGSGRGRLRRGRQAGLAGGAPDRGPERLDATRGRRGRRRRPRASPASR